MYSQKEEEKYILDYFKDLPNGNFVDIGAYDVFKFSNTRALYERGWSGWLIEPAPGNYKGIANHYEGEYRIKVLNFAIGATTEEIDFYDCGGDAISTSDESHRDKWGAAGVTYTKIKVQQISAGDFFNFREFNCDFLSIDTESTNMIVFNAIPEFVWHRLSMLCIEHDGSQEEIEEKLSKYGFTTRYVSSENIILAK